MIKTVFRASVLSAEGKPENNFILDFTLTCPVSKSQNYTSFSVLPHSEFAEKLCIINKSKKVERLVVNLKINALKYYWPHKT